MEESIIIHEIDRLDNLHSLVRQDLKELGIKLPKYKRVKKFNGSRNAQDEVSTNTVFGEPLKKVPAILLTGYGYVPQFLIDAAKVVDANIDTEGIFRKSGSISRQKELRHDIEAGKSMVSANVHDVASFIKQFLRELPEPLFVTVYQESFVRCFSLSLDKDQKRALLELCLLLPLEHIGALRYILHLLNRISANSEKNKMTSNNLALVMVPNLVHLSKGKEKLTSVEERLLRIHTSIIELLITNWQLLGLVSGDQRQQLSLMSDSCVTDDEQLEANDENAVSRRKRKRSGSLTGFVNSLAHGLAKLRRSTDGRSMNMTSGVNMTANMDMTANTSSSINMTSIDMTTSINMTCSSGEDMSLVTNDSMYQNQKLVDMTTPCVIRKRPMCVDNVAFSTSKKQAILGNLPQRSALASTPFTPASTVKRGYYNLNSGVKTADLNATAPAFGSLNVTTPALGSKTCKKRFMFTSPSGSKTKSSPSGSKMKSSPSGSKTKSSPSSSKVRRSSADPTRPESPPAHDKPGKSKNFFRRLSASRAGKHSARESSTVVSTEPSEDQLAGFGLDPAACHMTSAVTASQSVPPSAMEESVVVVDDQDPVNDFTDDASDLINKLKKQNCAPDLACEAQAHGCKVASSSQVRSEGLDDCSLREGCPPASENQQLDRRHRTPRRQILAKLDDLQNSSTNSNVSDGQKSSGFRRSRRDEFERKRKFGIKHKQEGNENIPERAGDFCHGQLEPGSYWHVENSPDPDRDGPPSQAGRNGELLEMLLPPPHGFGDQTLLMEEAAVGTAVEDEDIDVVSDLDGISLFSSESGGTVMRRTDSGQYLTHHSSSSSSLDSAGSYDSALNPSTQSKVLQPSVSKDSLFSTESYMSDGSARSMPRLTHYSSSDSGKGSLLGDASEGVSLEGSGKPTGAIVTKDKCYLVSQSDGKKKVNIR